MQDIRDFKTTGGQRAAAEILRLAPAAPTAIISGNDLMAIGALRELKSAGLRAPQDISVIGFDDISFASLAEPPFTTILIPVPKSAGMRLKRSFTRSRQDNLGREFKASAQFVVSWCANQPERRRPKNASVRGKRRPYEQDSGYDSGVDL